MNKIEKKLRTFKFPYLNSSFLFCPLPVLSDHEMVAEVFKLNLSNNKILYNTSKS